jgi:tetratricopeptide (TPR) repeat protein
MKKNRPARHPQRHPPGQSAPAKSLSPPVWARYRGTFPALCLLAITFIAYWPVWHAGFLWDDDLLLTANPHITQPGRLYQFWITTDNLDYFPLTSTVFWLEWRLWGLNPLGYHLVNVLLHAFSAVLCWRILLRLNLPGAWLAAAIFALHPVNVASVAWIAELKNTLAMLFFASALLAYVKFDDTGGRRWYWTSLGAFLLALLAKTAVAPLPFVLLGLAWWRRGRLTWTDLRRAAPFFFTAAILAVITIWFQYHRSIGSEIIRTDGLASRLAIAGQAVWFYLYKVALPFNLIPIYPRWPLGSLTALSFVPALLLAVAFFACWRYRQRWGRPLLFGFGYFVAMLLPVLGFLNIYFMRYSLVADHWQYFAMVGPAALAAAGFAAALRGRATVQILLGGALLLLLGVLTWRQAGLYRDPETFWLATLAGNPDCFVAENDLGQFLFQNGRTQEALDHFRKATVIYPRYAEAYYNIGDALLRLGRIDDAIAVLNQSLAINPNTVQAHNNLGNAFLQKGRVDDAIAQFQAAVQINPGYAYAHLNLGNALLQKNQPDDALAQFKIAQSLEPGVAKSLYDLANALAQKGQLNDAILDYEQALKLQPNYPDAHYNLANTLAQKGQFDDAIAHYEKALELQPGYTGAENNLGNAFLAKGDLPDAIAHYRNALELQPDLLSALNNLAWLLAAADQTSLRDGPQAVELAEHAAQLTGGQNPLVLRTLAAAYAETGRFPDAVATAQKALSLSSSQGPSALTDDLQAAIQRYQANNPP